MKSSPRRIAGIVLTELAVLALCGAIVFGYLERNVFDSARFADHAQAVLADDSVRTVAARELTDQIVNEVAPDAVAVGPLIETVTGAVIQSDAFGRAFRSAVLQLHRATVNGDADGAVLTIANVGVLINGALEKVAPGIARQIPDSFDGALVHVANIGAVADLANAAHKSRVWTRICLGLAVLFGLLAFLVSDRRRRLMREAGGSLLGAGLLLCILWFIARAWVIHRVGAEGVNELAAAREVWDSFLNGLLVDFVILAAVGAALTAVADGMLTGVDLEQRLRQIAARLLRAPEHSGRRVVWSIALLAAGIFIAFNAAFFARAVVVLFGILLGARGFQALAVMIAPPEAARGKGEEPRVKSGRARTRMLAAGSIVGVLLLALVIATHRGGGLETLGIVQSTTACNGSDSLCEKRLDQVALATTHNSMSAQTSPGFLFPSQERSIGKQLSDGIRGLQIDVYYGFPGTRVYTDADRSSPQARAVMEAEFGAEFVAAADRVRRSLSRPQGVAPQLYLCHGFCELGATKFADALGEIEDFLKANPREVISIVFEDYAPWQSIAEELQASGIAKYGYRGPWSGELPKLDEMIGSNRRVLLLTENARPDVPWMHNVYEFFQETPFNFPTIASLAAPSSCDEKRGSPENPMFLINHWVDTPPNPRPSVARRVNAFDFLWDRVERCRKERAHFPNMVAVDFYRVGDLFKVVDKLNGVR
ncbi:MAG: hypothetical protein QM648_02520 [Solirubrobacterales bacterium]